MGLGAPVAGAVLGHQSLWPPWLTSPCCHSGADDLLPILSYVVLQTGLPQLLSECTALEEFIHEGYVPGCWAMRAPLGSGQCHPPGTGLSGREVGGKSSSWERRAEGWWLCWCPGHGSVTAMMVRC